MGPWTLTDKLTNPTYFYCHLGLINLGILTYGKMKAIFITPCLKNHVPELSISVPIC